MIHSCNSVNSICSGSLALSPFRVPRVTVAGRVGASTKTATMKIQLTKGLFAEIDDGDFNSVSKHKWYAMKSKHTFYAATNAPMINGVRGKTILMHKLICGESSLVDHKDGNGLNNLRENLRPATKSLNAVNSKRRDGASSQHRGVVWDSKRNRWAAYARIGGKSKNLGRFKTEIEAAAAYRAVAIPAYGEFLRN